MTDASIKSRVAGGAAGDLYVWLAGVSVLIAFGLFAPTYWLQIPTGSFTGSPLLHLHGLLFSAWPLFFLSQALLAATGRIANHRALGLLGISLATAMLFSGFATAIHAMADGIAAGHGASARAFAIVPISAVVLFAGLVAAAIISVGRPETHKRLMLLATISILQAPLDRIFFALNAGIAPGLRPGTVPPPPVEATIAGGLLTLVLVVVAIVYDWRSRGRVHVANLAGGAIIAGAIFLRAPLSATLAWDAIAAYLVRFAG